MQFDLTTFALEVLNFLVLAWLLKRFFYKPVLAVIEARRAEGAGILDKAQALRSEADALKAQCEARLAQADLERVAARAELDQEIADERTRRLAAMDADMAGEHKRRASLDASQANQRESALERQGVALAARFAARLMDRMAGPELEARLADLALQDLPRQAPDRLEALRAALCEPGVSIKVLSAHGLDAPRRAAFGAALERLAGRPLAIGFSQDPALKAGVSVMAGSWVLMANLRDELGFFASSFDHGP